MQSTWNFDSIIALKVETFEPSKQLSLFWAPGYSDPGFEASVLEVLVLRFLFLGVSFFGGTQVSF